MSRRFGSLLAIGAASWLLACGTAPAGGTTKPSGAHPGAPDAARNANGNAKDAGSAAQPGAQPDAAGPASQGDGAMPAGPPANMPGPVMMDGGPLILLPADAQTPTPPDSGRAQSDVLLRMVSVPPSYALAGETMTYFPKLNESGDATMQLVDPPMDMSLANSRMSWAPDANEAGDHDVQLDAVLAGAKLSHRFEVHVGIATQLAQQDLSASKMGQVAVSAPLSSIVGAAISVPAGALAQTTSVSISQLDRAPAFPNHQGTIKPVKFGPSGLGFLKPATVALPYDKAGVTDVSKLAAYVYDDAHGRWISLPVVAIDEQDALIMAKASHFSIYAAGASSVDAVRSLWRMSAASSCEGEVVGRVQVGTPFDAIDATSINSRSSFIDDVLIPGGSSTLQALAQNPSFTGTLRAVSVLDLYAGNDPDRVALGERVLVTSVYLPGDGSAVVRHTDALGNLIGEHSYADVQSDWPSIAARLSGAATQARFGVHVETDLALAARVHLLYAEGDSSHEAVSVDDLGVALVDLGAPAPSDPMLADDALDADCDRLLGAYDPSDDRAQPVVVASPQDVTTVAQGQSLRLTARVDRASGTPVTSWDAGDPAATLTTISSTERDFSASKPGRYQVTFSASVGASNLSQLFAIDVLQPPALNSAPSCTPTASSGLISLGDTVALSAVVQDDESPASALSVQWGLVDRSGAQPALVATGGLSADNAQGAAFQPTATGSFELGCIASDGTLSGPMGVTSVSVLLPSANLPPEDLLLSPPAATLLLGATLTLHASASDRDGDALTFAWSGSPDLAAPSSGALQSDVLLTPSHSGVFTISVSVTDQHSPAFSVSASILVIDAPLSTTDADHDGYPAGTGPGTDCDDGNPAVNPAAKEICGNAVDENCDGVAAVDDCDGDGFTLQAGDCNDADRYIHPGAPEVCDGIDNDCNATVDDGFATGSPCSIGLGACQAAGMNACSTDGAFVTCWAVPGAPQPEVCDGIDNNCDGHVDENGVCNPTCPVGQSYDPDRAACVCPSGQLWSASSQSCAASCPSGQVPVYGSQSCRAAAPGDSCASAIDLGLGGALSGTLSGRGDSLAGCWSDTTSLRVVRMQIEAPGDMFSELTGNVSVSVFQGTCGGQPQKQCLSGHGLDHGTIAPGVYFLAIGGEGAFSLSFAQHDSQGACSVPDADGDGMTICDGDCDDHSAAVHPGAGEACDGLDNDCNGAVDDLPGSCATTLLGVCAQGRPVCSASGASCAPLYQPGQLSELCADGRDNNCDGQVDENGCTAALPGQSCATPLPGGYGGVFNGTFAMLEPPSSSCAQPGDGHAVIRFDVPANGIELSANAPSNVQTTLWKDACGGQPVMPCGKGVWHQSVAAGSYLLELSGQGAYSVAVGLRDSQSGTCLTPDGDGDGVTVCNGDCNDNDASIRPGAQETCDGIDNDCNGSVDDLQGTCATGLPGACNIGRRSCGSGGVAQCNLAISANQLPEYCNDGIDNNCDGRTDEAGCTSVAPGEICSLPVDIGNGGSFSGDLTGASDDVSGTCNTNGQSQPDHVYRVTVPAGAPYIADFELSGQVVASVLPGGCGPGYTAQTCFGGNPSGGSSSSQPAAQKNFEYWLDPGTYYLVIEGTGPYQLDVALRSSSTGTCLTADGDGDGYALCNGDCDDTDPSVHPGAPETCDGVDNDCNGTVDDMQGTCNTGLLGVCASGKPACGAGGAQCLPLPGPGQHAEICGDGLDNNCNGSTDEAGCTQLPPGEICALAIDVGQGGNFSGDLSSASDDMPSFCGGGVSTPERVYRLTVGTGSYGNATIRIAGQGVSGALFIGNCGDPQSVRSCFGGSGSGGPAEAMTSQWLAPGDYYLVLEGQGPYTLGIGLGDNTGSCELPDGDGDGYTICNGDCDDADGNVHPNALETCDLRDNDCNGLVDDPHQACSTGQGGACDAGDLRCVLGMPQCAARVTPGQLPEYCNDGLDNNCNGQVDEAGCTPVAQGELCSLPIDVGQGGTFVGDLTHATDDVSFTCDSTPHADYVYRLTVPNDSFYNASLRLEGAAQGSLFNSGCGAGGNLQACFGSLIANGQATMAQAQGEYYLGPGAYSVVVEGGGAYALSIGLRNANNGQCLTPDGDGDGFSLCDGDCDDHDPLRHPGVAEICDGLDNDCNGAIDDLTGTCSTGLPGACGEGLASCSGGAPQCSLSLLPGQLPEYCGDGQDNDCDGQSDEVGCTIVSPGEVCWLPIEAGTGGHFSGDLSTHTHDVMAGCWGNAPDLVYALRVPQGQSWQVNGVVQGAGAALIGSDCAHPNTFNCFGGTAAGDMPDAGAPPPPPDAGIPPADGGIAPPDGGFDGGIAPPDGGFDGGVAPPDGGFDGGVAPTDSGSATSASTLPSATSFSTTLSEGTHLIVVQGTGHFDLNLSIYDPATGHCITPDQDGDGFDPCQGDCNDSNAAIHPGAAEACDGIDNDCNGVIDDAHAACDTGQPGACAQGRTACNGTVTECMPLHAPLPEICADGVDNDCNGVTDEATCSARESCADAEDVGPGGSFYGNLDAAGNDVPNACSMAGGGDHVYRIQIPVNGGSFGVVGASGNVEVSLFQDVCGGSLYDCSNATRSFGWSGGTFYVVVKGSGAYALSLAIQNGGTQCSVPDLDGDGHTICDRDCNEGNASVYPGAAEICDGLDNDCDGVIDDVSGTCSTGLPGVCAQGTPSCNGTSLVCTPQHNPGATPDYCGDGLDNDCNGSIDEAGCTQVQPGEVCSLPIDMGPGGTFSGDLSSYAADVTAIDCGQGNDVVYKLDVPADGRHMASVRVGGNASLAMFTGACGQGYGSCFLSSSAVSLGSTGGTYYFVVKGSGPYTVSAAVRDLMNNSCSVGDHDGDGITLCDNDCNDLNPDIHPGAEELCDGIDNDCNGPIDDIKGSCPTGLPGACSQGTPYCSGGSAQCYVNLSPGQQADYCGDGIDNNCDGSTDEPSCLTVPPGEVCSLSIDLAQGGIFAGDLSSATDDVSGTCFGSGLPDRVYLLNVPQGQGYDVRVQLAGAEATLFGAQCDNGAFIQACFQPSSTQYRTLSPGAYHLVVEGSSSYMLSVGLRDSMTGVCLTPDADGDGMTQCDNDCNDADPSVHPGASELCGDGKDNDCDGVIDNGCP